MSASGDIRVLTVVGARPQFVKAAVVSRALAKVSGMCEVLVHTGQHHDVNMSDVFFQQMGIPPVAYHLGISGGGHGAQTGRMLAALEPVLMAERPDWVLVYGDTNSTLAGAVAAAKLRIPLAHVEAGLRSFNRVMPEEVNRVLTDHCADLLFCPTPTAVANLQHEGIGPGRIHHVGDVMYDAALFFRDRAASEAQMLPTLGLAPAGYVLATIHRAENTDARDRLTVIFEALRHIAAEVPVVVPLHPRTRQALEREGLLDGLDGQLRLTEPLGYLEMIELERNAKLIVTDSGGVQKEAFFFGVPCVTLRDETEWVELVDCGWNVLAPPVRATAVVKAIHDALERTPPEPRPALYGNGDAAGAIAHRLAVR